MQKPNENMKKSLQPIKSLDQLVVVYQSEYNFFDVNENIEVINRCLMNDETTSNKFYSSINKIYLYLKKNHEENKYLFKVISIFYEKTLNFCRKYVNSCKTINYNIISDKSYEFIDSNFPVKINSMNTSCMSRGNYISNTLYTSSPNIGLDGY